MAYVDLALIQTFIAGDILTAAAMQQNRDNGEFLIDPPAVAAFNSAPVSVASGTSSTALTADSESFDNDAMHSTSSQTSRFTAQTPGRFLAAATAKFAADAAGNRRIAFRVNGGTVYEQTLVAGTATNSTVITAVDFFTLAAGDYVEVLIWQTSGGALDVTLLRAGLTFITR